MNEERLSFARQEAAKAWRGKKTRGIEINALLVEEFTKILVVHMYEPHLGCATTGELMNELAARIDLNYKTIDLD